MSNHTNARIPRATVRVPSPIVSIWAIDASNTRTPPVTHAAVSHSHINTTQHSTCQCFLEALSLGFHSIHYCIREIQSEKEGRKGRKKEGRKQEKITQSLCIPRMVGLMVFAARAMPASMPPPDTGTSIASTSGKVSRISMAIVPCITFQKQFLLSNLNSKPIKSEPARRSPSRRRKEEQVWLQTWPFPHYTRPI
jgi:hypothetical protein